MIEWKRAFVKTEIRRLFHLAKKAAWQSKQKYAILSIFMENGLWAGERGVFHKR